MNLDNTLWMGGIHQGMTESQILTLFSFFNIFPIHIKLIKDKLKNKNRSYCFVTFKTREEAYYVLNCLNGKKIPNTNFIFKFNLADYKGVAKTLYVGNLNPNVTKENLFLFFKQRYKSVHNARIILDDNGRSKGYGFVNFKVEEDYYKCMKEMDGINFFGNNIIIKEQIRKEEENNNIINKKKKTNVQYNNNIYIKNNLININNIANNNDIMIQNNIINNINNNNIIDYNQNNYINMNNNSISTFNNNVHNIYGNNDMIRFPDDINNLLGINIPNNYSNEDKKFIPNSNLLIDNLINKQNLSSFFVNEISNPENIKIKNVENKINVIPKKEKANAIHKKDETKIEPKEKKIINKNKARKKIKLEVLEKIDEITLYKKIHESILRTFSCTQMLFSQTGIKFKCKYYIIIIFL